jgi:hypothetical protein
MFLRNCSGVFTRLHGTVSVALLHQYHLKYNNIENLKCTLAIPDFTSAEWFSGVRYIIQEFLSFLLAEVGI